MKKLFLALSVASLGLVGCAGFAIAPVSPAPGLIYSNYKAPLDIDYEATQVGGSHGTSEAISVLGAVTIGDASMATAAANGGLNSIHHADYEVFNVLGVFSRFTIHAYGN